MPKRNIELLKRLRMRFLRMRHAAHFNMRSVARKTECGTAMCFVGHTLDVAGYKRKYTGDETFSEGQYTWFYPNSDNIVDSPFNQAAEELGIEAGDANDLFYKYSIKTPKQAAAEIQKLIEGT